MHKCVVCSNSSWNSHPGTTFHQFPKNENRRREWLNVYGIDLWYSWYRVCSNHFLEEHYKTGGRQKGRRLKTNVIPQPTDQNCDENGFLSNCTQSNDVEMDNTEILPTEQNCFSYTTQSSDVATSTNVLLLEEENCLREVQNAVVNDFESPRQSRRKIKLTTLNDDMIYENIPRLQTEQFERQVPTSIANDNIQSALATELTTAKDLTLGNRRNRIRCSVKNCFNRRSKDLSFFKYPSDLTLRKEWIEKCGIDPTKNISGNVNVCSTHFDDDCFKNTQLRNRLKNGAVPSLFLYNDTTDPINCIPSTSSPVDSGCIDVNIPSPVDSELVHVNKRSPVNNRFIRAHKPSSSSSNMASNQTPLLVHSNSTTHSAKDFEGYSSIPGCITNTIEQMPMNAGLSASNSTAFIQQLETNDVPVLRSYTGKLKRHKRDELLCTKIIKNNMLDKSIATNDKMFKQLNKPENFSANRSLSITLEPTESSKITKPSVDLFSKVSAKSSIGITLQPKHNSSSTPNVINSAELHEMKTSVISKCISLEVNSDTHDSNSDYSTNSSECIIDDDHTEDFEEKDNGFIHEISKRVVLPSKFWKCEYDRSQNSTTFYQDNLYETVKTINFYNSLLPKIQVYGKKYKYNKVIRTLNNLKHFLKQIDNIEKCSGIADDNCIGYYDKIAVDVTSCSVCREKYQELHNITERFEQKNSERIENGLKLRKNLEKNKINHTPTELVTLRPFSLINSMRARHH